MNNWGFLSVKFTFGEIMLIFLSIIVLYLFVMSKMYQNVYLFN
uniref:Uncharacterized protein n=1 Tax=Arundo donax TaxID=35708 RepID=A0A0A9EKR0_ARUDO